MFLGGEPPSARSCLSVSPPPLPHPPTSSSCCCCSALYLPGTRWNQVVQTFCLHFSMFPW